MKKSFKIYNKKRLKYKRMNKYNKMRWRNKFIKNQRKALMMRAVSTMTIQTLSSK